MDGNQAAETEYDREKAAMGLTLLAFLVGVGVLLGYAIWGL